MARARIGHIGRHPRTDPADQLVVRHSSSGRDSTTVLPGPDVAIGAFALVAMAATFGAATQATFTAIVFVFELTRDYDVVLPLMLATVHRRHRVQRRERGQS